MKRAFLLLALALVGLATPAFAHEYKVGALVLTHPWTRATPPGAEVAAAYVKIVNEGDTADRLVAISSPLAEMGEIHEMKMDGDVMQMRKLEGGLEIAPGATVELKPGGFHGMLMKLKESFVKDGAVKATFTFEKAGPIEVELVVEDMGATESHTGHE
ncbi:MAG: copper chaperone PCu(A)C [Hyphomicrobiaceae bacterium]